MSEEIPSVLLPTFNFENSEIISAVMNRYFSKAQSKFFLNVAQSGLKFNLFNDYLRFKTGRDI